jgi:hypothetical protein
MDRILILFFNFILVILLGAFVSFKGYSLKNQLRVYVRNVLLQGYRQVIRLPLMKNS